MKGNVIVGQSGGPTAVINSSLAGVFKTAKANGAGVVYGMLHGIEGFLDGKYIDMSEHFKNDLDIELLKRTPSAYLGSCRFKLPTVEKNRPMYEEIVRRLKKLDIKYFFYIGGNDSMDTIKQLADYAAETNLDINFVGVPKTIDNDLAVTDHTPGYGSAAKYIATTVKEITIDSLGLTYNKNMITIVEIMGRNAGWLTAAAALSRGEDCPGPDMIYLPEVVFDIDDFTQKVREKLTKKQALVICVSEGIKVADGRYVCELASNSDYVDAFGHKQMGGTASFLANYLGSEIGCKTRGIELSTLQRSASHIASLSDITEAFAVGAHAVRAAAAGETGKVVVLVRNCNFPYQCGTDTYDVHSIANEEKTIPLDWILAEEAYVTEDFITYAKPLIRGELTPVMVDGIPRHALNKEL